MGARFSAPVQTGTEAHPASYTMGTGSFLGVKQPGHGTDHPPPSSAEVEGRVEPYFCSPSGPEWPVLGRTLPLPFTFKCILEPFTFKYILEPIVWECQAGSMISNVVHSWQLTAAYNQYVFVFLSSDFQGNGRFERAIVQI